MKTTKPEMTIKTQATTVTKVDRVSGDALSEGCGVEASIRCALTLEVTGAPTDW